MRKSRRNCFLPHLHAENSMISSMVGMISSMVTDHKPITAIVNKPLNLAPVRLQRMLLQLQK